MKAPFLIIIIFLAVLCMDGVAAPNGATPEIEVRQKLVSAILSTGDEQQKILTDLADSGSKIVRDVLTAWPRDQVIVYESGAEKMPAVIEEEADADGKVRALRIDNGEFLKDD